MTVTSAGCKGGGLIDVHHHIGPPSWIALLKDKNVLHGPWETWSSAKAIEEMDRSGVAMSLASVTTPGVWFGDRAIARRIARECNEYAAQLAVNHPTRFGNFATLPLPDVEGALHEIEYALDELKADGICLYTSYGDKWLGDDALAPIFDELNRRKALVYVHPTTPNCCKGILPFLLASVVEYGTDTTRAIASLVFTGASSRYQDVRMIFSHAGGTMPFLIERFLQQKRASDLDPNIPRSSLGALDPIKEVSRFYYDTAQSTHPAPMSALRKVVPVSQIVFGTDFPYRSIQEQVAGLSNSGVFSAADLDAIGRTNVLRLIPQHIEAIEK